LPFAFALWLVVVKLACELGAVGIFPLSLRNLAIIPFSYEFHSCLEEYICTLSMLLTIFPVSRVDILVNIGHDSFTVSEVIFPVTVVCALSYIDHFTNAMLHI